MAYYPELLTNFNNIQTEIRSIIPTVNWGIKKINPEFIVIATGILRATNSYSYNNPISWSLLEDSDHGISFFSSVTGSTPGVGALLINYPPVKNVLWANVLPDEAIVQEGVSFGTSVGTSQTSVYARKPVNTGLRLVGNGTYTLTKQGSGASNSVSIMNSTTGKINLISTPVVGTNNRNRYDISVNYTGPNRYTIETVTADSGYEYAFRIIDVSGSIVTSAPTSSDIFHVNGIGVSYEIVDLQRWLFNNKFFESSFVNMWALGFFEAYMVVIRTSSTSFLIKWQQYTGATSYKIYRDTSSTFSTQTLIYSGTELKYDDAGLTTNVIYYYKMVAVISGVDTEITTFVAKCQ